MSIACSINLNTTLTPEQRERYQNGDQIQQLLASMRKVAIIGLSTESTKASNMVASYLLDEGFEVIPVHPKADLILGQKVYRSLAEVPFAVDVVNVFRPGHEMWDITDQAIANGAKAVWSQLRIINFDAGNRAIDAGLVAVQDKCIKMEHGRYGGMLHWAGMNTEVISAKRRVIG
jgi:predicted CoA-binding protein